MKNFFAFLVLFFCLITSTYAQTEWRKKMRLAESAELNGKYSEAASMYEAAWEANNKKTRSIYRAAELYTLVRDYQRAADCYKTLKDDKDFSLARLYYARALRQTGAYEKAMAEYAIFSGDYGGKDADKLRDEVLREIRGCEMGIQYNRTLAESPVRVQRLGTTVNSTETEFAPIGFGDDLLYFSSNVMGKALIYRSQKQNGVWSRAVIPSGFPDFKNRSLCNGSFSPDNSRFYFTECSADKGLQAICQIYVMSRSGDQWSEPQILPSYVNVPGYTSTHPSIAGINGKEFLFFSSNKPGGKGGMDIYCVRIYPDKKEPTVGLPINLGEQINTEGNEVTPFFDSSENALYFSSTAHISIGGLDIQKSKWQGSGESYGKAENVGMPYNSSADDYYFSKQKNKNSGFLVSNRSFSNRPTTTDDDILAFSILQKKLVVKGVVSDKCEGQQLADSRVNLYEITANGQQRLLNTQLSKDGTFSFELLPEKKFRLEAEKQGFRSNFFDISSSGEVIALKQENNIELDCNLDLKDATTTAIAEKKDTTSAENTEKAGSLAVEEKAPTVNVVNSDKLIEQRKEIVNNKIKMTHVIKESVSVVGIAEQTASIEKVQAALGASSARAASLAERTAALLEPVKGTTSVGTMPLYETTSKRNEALITSAPKHPGAYFKIQIVAMKRFDFEEKRYDPIRGMGRADMEYIVKKDMVRVLLADFFKREDAQKLLPEIRKNREFSGAFIVQYTDGVRH